MAVMILDLNDNNIAAKNIIRNQQHWSDDGVSSS